MPTPSTATANAAFDTGSALNPSWGSIFNSVPFGFGFEEYIEWLYSPAVKRASRGGNGL